MKLYHFCGEKFVKSIRHDGLKVGMVCVPGKRGLEVYRGWIWLTLDGDAQNQSWATRILIPYSRTAWRVTVDIPDAYLHRLADRKMLQTIIPGSGVLFDGWPGSESWRVYHGTIPPSWVTDIIRTDQEDTQ